VVAGVGRPTPTRRDAAYLLVQGDGGHAGLGRAGLPIILNPDWGVGESWEWAGRGCFRPSGVQAELIGDVFYGAATWTSGVTTIPMLSVQAGLFADFEVLP